MTQFSNRQLPAASIDRAVDPVEAAIKEAGEAAPQQGAARQNALTAVHRIFRGRYHWLVILGAILGGAGAYAGYKRGHQIYTCSGAIRVNYYIPRISNSGDDTGSGEMRGYDAFVQQQQQALLSRRVITEAVKDPQWSGLVPIEDENIAVQDLMRRLKVSQKGDQLVVESSDTDAAQATAAVNVTVAAYRKLFVELDPETSDPVIMGLKNSAATLQKQLIDKNAVLKTKSDEAHADNLDAEYTSKQQQASIVEARIQELITQIAVAKLDVGKRQLEGISDDALKQMEPQLKGLEAELSAAKANFTKVKMGMTGSNPKALQDAQAGIRAVEDEISGRVEQLHEWDKVGLPIPGLPRLATPKDIDELQAKVDVLTPQSERLRNELVTIGRQNLELKSLRAERDDIRVKLDTVEQRIQNQRIENPMKRRVEVLSEGEFPLSPDKDTRKKLAAAGGAAGLVFATFGVALLGLTSRKLRAPHDLQIRLEAKPVLGVIPSLEEGPDFAQRAALASECVHRSRTMLEIWGRGTKKMVIGVTSPTHGSGNTSVAMSLGVSFAAAGMKTLLVDCDFVTTGLTPRLQAHVRRDIGTVMVRTGLVTETQLNHAKRVLEQEESNAAVGKRSIGQVCVELRYISQAELDAALAVQQKESIGILDALAGEDLQSCIGKTGIRNLSLLPRANATPAHAAKLSSQSLRAVLENAREIYDTVIVDTSAILSGLEASIVASAVDGMVVTVARGEERSKLQKTLARLQSLECPVAGLIFNHVLPGDMPTPAPLDGSSVDHEALMRDSMDLDLAGRLSELGPLASSVVSRVPITDRETELG